MPTRLSTLAVTLSLLALGSACTSADGAARDARPVRTAGDAWTVKDTVIQDAATAIGTAAPIREATLATKLMGSVVSVRVKEGDTVTAGQLLLRLDARDVTAREAQAAAATADANARLTEATAQAVRIRGLYADSAATRAQLDAAEAALARAEALARAGSAAQRELAVTAAYAEIRAPFAGVITRRYVDPGALATPGAPLLALQDASALRVSAATTPDAVAGIRRGQRLSGTIEEQPVEARVEGVVPAAAGNLYAVNAIVANRGGRFLAGSSATLLLPRGTRPALVVPLDAITRDGDLTGVILRGAVSDDVRWVRVGQRVGDGIEVTAGLRPGDVVILRSRAGAPGRDR